MTPNFPLILALDVTGQPGRWIPAIGDNSSAYYYAKDLVAWSMSPVEFTLHGGINAVTGQQSTMTINTIIAIKGKITEKRRQAQFRIPPLTNKALFRRDRNMCAYCGRLFRASSLTRDHVIPRGQNGRDVWENVVASCAHCNKHKDNRTPEQAGLELLYVPYAPNRAEWLILQNKNILVDQMTFLMKQVPQDSRLHEEQ